jgi:hypothetical protein
MPDTHGVRTPVPRCQARPRAARPGYREDMLCASSANTVVLFHGVEMPVCRIHDAKYARWGADGEAQAVLQWGWKPPEPLADATASGEPRLSPTWA